LPTEDGLRLMTAWLMLSFADILRMGANQRRLAAVGRDERLFMPQFLPPHDSTAIAHLTERLYGAPRPDVSDRVLAGFRARLREQEAQGSHVTRNRLDASARAQLVARLEEDPVLGPVLSRVRDAVCEGADHTWCDGALARGRSVRFFAFE